MTSRAVDINPYSREYLDRLGRIKDIRVASNSERDQDVLTSRWFGESLTVPVVQADKLHKSQRTIGEQFLRPVSASRPSSRSREPRHEGSPASQRSRYSVSAQSTYNSDGNGSALSSSNHRTFFKSQLSTAKASSNVKDLLLSLQDLDDAIKRAESDLHINIPRRHQRCTSPSPSSCSAATTKSAWVPYGHGTSDRASSAHRNVANQENIDRGMQHQLLRRLKHSARSSESLLIDSTLKHTSDEMSSRYMSNSRVIVRASLVKSSHRVIHGMLVLKKFNTSIASLVSDIAEQWRLNVSSIHDLRFITLSQYANRMNMRCLSLGTIEPQPCFEDNNCHVEVFLTSDPDLVSSHNDNSLRDTIRRVVNADNRSKLKLLSTLKANSKLMSSYKGSKNNGDIPLNSYASNIERYNVDGISDVQSIEANTKRRYKFFSPPRVANVLLGYDPSKFYGTSNDDVDESCEVNYSNLQVNGVCESESESSPIISSTQYQEQLYRCIYSNEYDSDCSDQLTSGSRNENAMTRLPLLPEEETHLHSNDTGMYGSNISKWISSSPSSSMKSESQYSDEIHTNYSSTDHRVTAALEFIPLPIRTTLHNISSSYSSPDQDTSEEEDCVVVSSVQSPELIYTMSDITTDDHSLMSSAISQPLQHDFVDHLPDSVNKSTVRIESAPVPLSLAGASKLSEEEKTVSNVKEKERTKSPSWQRIVQLDLNDFMMDFD